MTATAGIGVEGSALPTPPSRRGTRDERRSRTLGALVGDGDAPCAYCGRPLPPMPARGGRPTPYCPADPERYGHWGTKVITCAMLDEYREVWVQVYGPDQPMTRLDVATLDERLTVVRTAVQPLLDEVAAVQAYLTQQTAAAITTSEDASAARDDANRAMVEALAARDDALANAEAAAAASEADQIARAEADTRASEAEATAENALTAQRAAETARDEAQRERQHALDQVISAQRQVTDLQQTLNSERVAAVDNLARLRAEWSTAEQALRTTLTEDYEARLAAQADAFATKERALQQHADARIDKLTADLAIATRAYADELGQLHTDKAALASDLIRQTAAASEAEQRLRGLEADLAGVLERSADTGADVLRQHIAQLLAKGRPDVDVP